MFNCFSSLDRLKDLSSICYIQSSEPKNLASCLAVGTVLKYLGGNALPVFDL